MALKKTILTCLVALVVILVVWVPIQARASETMENRSGFHPYPLPWLVAHRDSTATYFAAFLTLPDTVAGLPTEAWLDTAKPTSQSLAIYIRRPLAEDEKRLLAALRALLRMDWLDAMLAHREALALGAKQRFYPSFLANSGLLLLAVGEPQEGERRLREAARLSERHTGKAARRSLAHLFLAQGRYAEADSLIGVELRHFPQDGFALQAKSFVLRQSGNDSAYEAFLARQTVSRRSNAMLQKTYGDLLLRQGRYQEAAQLFQRAVEANAQDGDAWVGLGHAFKAQGLWFFAEESLRRALNVGTHDLSVYATYAEVLFQFFLGRNRQDAERALAEVQRLLEQGMARQLQHAAGVRLLYDIYAYQGNRKAAEALRRNLWFHFEGPGQSLPSSSSLNPKVGEPARYLPLGLSSTTFPIFSYLQDHEAWPREPGTQP
jgi:tetratricopeptide (TPR) repeat protein